MLKKSITMLLVVLLIAMSFVGCKSSETSDVQVGMVTDSGTIDDKSFNQGTWEGIKAAEKEHGVKTTYLKPSGETTDDYLTEIGNLVDAGNTLIVTPGYKFEAAIFAAQDEYPEVSFILIDGKPNNGKFDDTRVEKVGDNTVSIFFAEHEAGFLAGVASALESKTGKLGFIGGMEIPPVQKFGWGYVAGVAYANATYGTTAEVVDYLYEGSFSNVEAGQQLAASMYDKGVDVIFCAAGGVGVGAINEAKARRNSEEDVYVVGVDVNQYNDGLLEDGTSAILTSALKRIDVAALDNIADFLDDKFKGGEVLTLTAKNNGVGLPAENPNLTTETTDKTDETLEKLKDDSVVVPFELDGLNSYLTEQGYTTATGVEY